MKQKHFSIPIIMLISLLLFSVMVLGGGGAVHLRIIFHKLRTQFSPAPGQSRAEPRKSQ